MIKEGMNSQEAQLEINRIECTLKIGKDIKGIEKAKEVGLNLLTKFPNLVSCPLLRKSVAGKLKKLETEKEEAGKEA